MTRVTLSLFPVSLCHRFEVVGKSRHDGPHVRHLTLTSPHSCRYYLTAGSGAAALLPSAIGLMAELVHSRQNLFSLSFVTGRGRGDSTAMRDGPQKLGR